MKSKYRIGKKQFELIDAMANGYVVRVLHQFSNGQHLITLKHENDDELPMNVSWDFVSKLEGRGFFDIEEQSMCTDIDMYTYRLKPEIKTAFIAGAQLNEQKWIRVEDVTFDMLDLNFGISDEFLVVTDMGMYEFARFDNAYKRWYCRNNEPIDVIKISPLPAKPE